MKTLILIFSIIGLVTLNSCNQNFDSKAVLDNPETRNELFKTIYDNHEYMTAFMDNMSTSDHAMQMMQGNTAMMKTMMNESGMQMMMTDSTMMKSMMNNGQMMSQMIQMMHQHGIISTECMNDCMKNMSNKGMHMSTMEMKK